MTLENNGVDDPDRLLPADPSTRSVARELYESVADSAIVSPHGHVDAATLAMDKPFSDAAALFVSPDHYVTRLLHADGVAFPDFSVDAGTSPEAVWATFAEHWPAFVGTASGYWLREELRSIFGVAWPPRDRSEIQASFDRITAMLTRPQFRPRALFHQFGIEILATTDDPLADLTAHAQLRDDKSFTGRVIPTFRPDAYTNSRRPDFAANIDRLLASTGDTGYEGYLDALRSHRARFIDHGATSIDISTLSPATATLDDSDARALFDRVRGGNASSADADLFDAMMIMQHARMCAVDGLVLTLHPGSLRDHHTPTHAEWGADTGHDIPVPVDFTRALRPLLSELGTVPGFHLVIYTMDETTFSRELAPLAGFYPSVFLGSPWWFLDAPHALARFRSATIETAGFRRYAGFVDDTRAFCSIPVRHDVARRVDASVIASLVVEGRLSLQEAMDSIRYGVEEAPRKVFKL